MHVQYQKIITIVDFSVDFSVYYSCVTELRVVSTNQGLDSNTM